MDGKKELGPGIEFEPAHELPPPPPEHASSQELLENMIAEQRARMKTKEGVETPHGFLYFLSDPNGNDVDFVEDHENTHPEGNKVLVKAELDFNVPGAVTSVEIVERGDAAGAPSEGSIAREIYNYVDANADTMREAVLLAKERLMQGAA